MFLENYLITNQHHYTFAATGVKVKPRVFATRRLANEHMYKLMHKYGLSIRKIYEDGPYNTYVCNNDVRFYIQQA